MKKTSFHILRIGLAITFFWIGVLIFREPEAWGGYISPWALDLLPMSIKDAMIGTAILDMILGVLFLINSFVWLAALIGSGHLLMVLLVSGINEGTVRDIGILAGTMALTAEFLPERLANKIRSWRKEKYGVESM